jgi:hypothetical protein
MMGKLYIMVQIITTKLLKTNNNNMGMFDYLFIDTNMLPISDEEKIIIGDESEWQTKDFDNVMTEIYITNDGELKINQWEYEVVPKEERPHPDGDGIAGLAGSLRRSNEELETIPYHGYVNFYNSINREWYEFRAKFTDGKLIEIKRTE